MANLAQVQQQRRGDWNRLEALLLEVATSRLRGAKGELITEISDYYRRACADLAMADQYQLSPSSVDYLHGLVGRAHNALYRSRQFQFHHWWELAIGHVPRKIFHDRCVQVSAVLFFGLFSLSTFLAYDRDRFPQFAESIMGPDTIEQLESSFDQPLSRRFEESMTMVAFYIQHNTGIGLTCFALGPLVIPGLFATSYNAVVLGASFGYMARPDTVGGDVFLEFVTAHGAFELTAIAISAGAGLRIGMGWMFTQGLTRFASLQKQAREAVPIMGVGAVLFVLAALTEGLLSPTSISYLFKAAWAMFSSALLMFYFIVLGYPSESHVATGQDGN